MASGDGNDDRTVLLSPKGPGEPWQQAIGGYQVVRRLGEGGMGLVLLGRDPELQRDVAIKLVRRELVGNSLFMERFFREARLSAQLNHPNVVTTYRAGKEGETPFLVLEFVEGSTLRDLLQTPPPMPLGRILEIFVQCCDGLDAAAKKGIVHRDFKPANVMVRPDGIAKLMDFGLAKELRGDATSMATAVLGTPEYMSPEQARAERVDFRTDVYAMGISIFQCATGYLPFKESSAFETIRAHTEKPMPEDPRLAAVADGRLAELLRRMTAKSPSDRPQSYAEIRAELKAIAELAGDAAAKPLAPLGAQGDRPTPARRTPSGARKSSEAQARRKGSGARTAAAILVAVGAAAAIGGAAWMATRGKTPPSTGREPAAPAVAAASETPAPPRETGISLKVERGGTAADLLRQLGNMGANLTVASDLDAKRIPLNARFSGRRAEDIAAATAIACGWETTERDGVVDVRPGASIPSPEFASSRANLAPSEMPRVTLNTLGVKLTLRMFCEALAQDRGIDYVLAGTGTGEIELPPISLSNVPLSAAMDTLAERGAPIRWTYARETLLVVPKRP